MPDPYQPPLADFEFTPQEQAAVAAALLQVDPWDWKPGDDAQAAALKGAKDRILQFHLARHGGTCCYCRTNLHGAGPFMTDREHVLPKGQAAYKALCYTPWNLGVACKRCNMQFKGAGIAFVIDPDAPAALQDSSNYRFVHPNFDAWGTHLTRVAMQVNAELLVHYRRQPDSAKAAYTYDFFRFDRLELDSFDRAQGGAAPEPSTGLTEAVRDLAERYGQ